MKSRSGKRRTYREHWYFYSRSGWDAYDEEDSAAVMKPLVKGWFARERAIRPVEVQDGPASAEESGFVLIGRWLQIYEDVIEVNTVAYCPAKNMLAEVKGTPIDDQGNRQEVFIYIMDNVFRGVDASLYPLEMSV